MKPRGFALRRKLSIGNGWAAKKGSPTKPTYAELCRAIQTLTDDLVLQRDVLFDDFTNAVGQYRDESDRLAIAELDAKICGYKDLLGRAGYRRPKTGMPARPNRSE